MKGVDKSSSLCAVVSALNCIYTVARRLWRPKTSAYYLVLHYMPESVISVIAGMETGAVRFDSPSQTS